MKDREFLHEGYVGYLLSPDSQIELLEKVHPMFDDRPSHFHVTHTFGIGPNAGDKLINNISDDILTVIAEASNDAIQALIVEVNGNTRRNDGSVYHITWSLDRKAGAKPVHSNNLVKNKSTWEYIQPTQITVTPQFFK